MYLKLLKNDLKKNPWSNGILLLFICLSAMIAVSVTLMLTQLFSSISSMYETANPPHFLQMHKGELNQTDLDEFNKKYEGITHWQTVHLINIYGEDISVSNGQGENVSLSSCRLDISFMAQNEKYDVLLDENKKPLSVNEGEICVPIILLDEFDIEVGNTITVNTGKTVRNFIVTAFAYDGQMNSTLCSSTRFLINAADFEELYKDAAETEYLIEAWFTDSSMAAAYQTAYEQSEKNLPKNGQAVTYTMIFLLSALTDLLMAVVFMMAGALLIVIALVCLRYAVLAELEENMREIGTMKAIGIAKKGIRSLYLVKIRMLTLIGCILGFLLGRLCISMLCKHISRTFGTMPVKFSSLCLSVFSAVLVYGIILLFTKKILNRLEKASVTDLLVTEKGFAKKSSGVSACFSSANHFSVNLLLGVHEVRKGYGIIFSLLLIVSFLVTVPLRTVQTLENKEFASYMGSPLCDLLLEVEQGEDLEGRNALAKKILDDEVKQGSISQIDFLRKVRLQVLNENGEVVGVHIDIGENAGAGLKYLTGENPKNNDEIALSYIMSEELKKNVGDIVEILSKGERLKLKVCGVYQDVTSGGRTAKAVRQFPEEASEKYSYYIMLPKSENYNKNLTLKSENADKLASFLREQLKSGYSIENMDEFLRQTIGGVTSQVRQAGILVLLIGVFLAILITALFLKLRLARERSAITVKKAIGIPFTAIRKQELYPILIAGGLGATCGVLLSELFGSQLISGLLGMLGMGLKNIVFVNVPVWQYPVIPIILLATLTVVTMGICRQIKHMDTAGNLNE